MGFEWIQNNCIELVSISTACASVYYAYQANKLANTSNTNSQEANVKADIANGIAEESNEKSNEANLLSKQANNLAINVEFKKYYLTIFYLRDELSNVNEMLNNDNHIGLDELGCEISKKVNTLNPEDVPLVNREAFKVLEQSVSEFETLVGDYHRVKQAKTLKKEKPNKDTPLRERLGANSDVKIFKKEIKDANKKVLESIDVILEMF